MLTFFVFLIFVPVLVLILLLLNIFLSPHEPITEKVDAYECGFYPVGEQTRHPFIINYFLICLIFLVFEAEVLMFLPSIPTLIYVGSYGIIVAIIFFLLLTLGFVYEIGKGALNMNNVLPVTSKNDSDIRDQSNDQFNKINISSVLDNEEYKDKDSLSMKNVTSSSTLLQSSPINEIFKWIIKQMITPNRIAGIQVYFVFKLVDKYYSQVAWLHLTDWCWIDKVIWCLILAILIFNFNIFIFKPVFRNWNKLISFNQYFWNWYSVTSIIRAITENISTLWKGKDFSFKYDYNNSVCNWVGQDDSIPSSPFPVIPFVYGEEERFKILKALIGLPRVHNYQTVAVWPGSGQWPGRYVLYDHTPNNPGPLVHVCPSSYKYRDLSDPLSKPENVDLQKDFFSAPITPAFPPITPPFPNSNALDDVLNGI